MNLILVEQIVSVLGEYPVSEITVEQEGRRVTARRPLAAPPAVPLRSATEPPASESAEATVAESEAAPPATQTLTATMVGIFHQAAPPVVPGAVLQAGQRVGFIESMKLMNDVPAESGGRVSEVLVEDGAPVEYGQSLFRLASE